MIKVREKIRQRKSGSPKSRKSADDNANLALDLRKRLQLTQPAFARLVPMSIRSLATIESGKEPTESVARRLIELRRLIDALSEAMTRQSLGSWIQTPNSAFEGLKPIEVIERGESDRLWSMVYFLRSGVPS